MTTARSHGAGDSAPSAPAFTPVQLRQRHDGLTPARQVALIQALAECGCVREACARVGISPEAVYRLRRRPDAQSFRLAMDVALDGAIDRVEEGVFARAIAGVEVPHYYKGELVGTHRRYDERLALFLLRYRKPHRYGKHHDRGGQPDHPEKTALGMAELLTWVASDAHREAAGLRRQVSTAIAGEDEDGEPLTFPNLFRWGPAFGAPTDEEEDEYFDLAEDPPFPDVPSTSSTSGTPPNRRMRRKAAAKARKR